MGKEEKYMTSTTRMVLEGIWAAGSTKEKKIFWFPDRHYESQTFAGVRKDTHKFLKSNNHLMPQLPLPLKKTLQFSACLAHACKDQNTF